MEAFLGSLPLERVVELHLAGGEAFGDYWLDAHSGPTPARVRAIAQEIVSDLPNLQLINFELLPAFFETFGEAALEDELAFCQRLRTARAEPRRRRGPIEQRRHLPEATGLPDPRGWEDALAGLTVRDDDTAGSVPGLADDPGVGVLRMLVQELRAGMVSRALKLTTRLLLLHLGEAGTRRVLADFWRTRPPEFFAFEEAETFAAHLVAQDIVIDHLDAVLAFELAVIRAHIDGGSTSVQFLGDPECILAALAAGRMPARPTEPPRALVVCAS
jgi:hypothetical protein